MDLQCLLDEKNISRYRLSQISGVPKTTITDICSGKSSLANCNAKTVYLLAKALNLPMEELIDGRLTKKQTLKKGAPMDNGYLECNLPKYLHESLAQMIEAWRKVDAGERYVRFDGDYCTLQSDINCAEVNKEISEDQAWYLREKYLRIERE